MGYSVNFKLHARGEKLKSLLTHTGEPEISAIFTCRRLLNNLGELA